MDTETKQRLRYLVEHGGVWEQARDKYERMHYITIGALALVVVMQLADLVILLLR